jgi:dihydropteroate synthase
MKINGREFDFSRTVYVMGILNVTPDSFSDGGKHNTFQAAVAHAAALAQEGADILDVGGESSRPGSLPVGEQEEIDRVIPVIEAIQKQIRIPVSVDTTKAKVAQVAFAAGAGMINDISGLTKDPQMKEVAARAQCSISLMHMKGTPETMQKNPFYKDVIAEVKSYFRERLEEAQKGGIQKDKIILDVGIGFGKRLEDNLILLNRLNEFKEFGCPLMVGTSRKSFIGTILKQADPEKRLFGTMGSLALAITRGANLLRVHDVRAAREMLTVMSAIQKEKI